jgi:threonine dehydrogenase-like Zn-dependent dehydrogenase
MKAWVFHDFGDMRLEEVPDPKAKPGYAVCKIRRVQPSITDVQRALGIGTINSALLKKQLEEHAPVQLLGHEMSAEVIEVGEGVSTLNKGDIVCTSGHIPCGVCDWCKEGKDPWCVDKIHVGINTPGAFAEMISLPEEGLVKVPDILDDMSVACLQPFSSAVAAVRDSKISVGDSVAVTGQGVMGIYILQAARMCGAGSVFVTDVKEEALSLSEKFAADLVINAIEKDAVSEVLKATKGKGVDIVFECAGGNPDQGLSGHETKQQAFEMVRIGGKVVQVAGLVGSVNIDPVFMRTQGINWLFPEGHGRDTISLGADWVAGGRIDLKSLVTHEVTGIEKLPEAMEITHKKEEYKATNPCQVVLE